ncbi:MAG: beta-mannosidase [Candidatus Marinimicrobia bacterium]|nr:beta-mannosidase [Candidatus Neomarinimicrobiota bacterium]
MKNGFILTLVIMLGILFSACEESPAAKYADPRAENLRAAIQSAQNLLENSVSGSGEGEFLAADGEALNEAIEIAETFINRDLSSETQSRIDNVTDALYQACCVFESRVNSGLNDLIDTRATRETRYLYDNLKRMAPEYLLFGMHDATGYGVGWSSDDVRSDVKDVCGDYPAVFSWDAHTIINGSNNDIERLAFRILYTHNLGGITTICWHQNDPENKSFYHDRVGYDPVPMMLPGGQHHENYRKKLQKIARFFQHLCGEKGESVPVIFRPYHEQNGSWFWWGKGHRTGAEYVDLWRFTVRYLRDSLGVHNFIYAFSPDGNQYDSKAQYLIDYPGDDYVDIFGVDFYFAYGNYDELYKFRNRLIHIAEYAEERVKLAALTEAGDRKGWNTSELLIENWFTSCLLGPIVIHQTAKKVAYAAVWRNASESHHFAPYPGHPSVTDFIGFYTDERTFFLNDLPDVFQYMTPLPK